MNIQNLPASLGELIGKHLSQVDAKAVRSTCQALSELGTRIAFKCLDIKPDELDHSNHASGNADLIQKLERVGRYARTIRVWSRSIPAQVMDLLSQYCTNAEHLILPSNIEHEITVISGIIADPDQIQEQTHSYIDVLPNVKRVSYKVFEDMNGTGTADSGAGHLIMMDWRGPVLDLKHQLRSLDIDRVHDKVSDAELTALLMQLDQLAELAIPAHLFVLDAIAIMRSPFDLASRLQRLKLYQQPPFPCNAQPGHALLCDHHETSSFAPWPSDVVFPRLRRLESSVCAKSGLLWHTVCANRSLPNLEELRLEACNRCPRDANLSALEHIAGGSEEQWKSVARILAKEYQPLTVDEKEQLALVGARCRQMGRVLIIS